MTDRTAIDTIKGYFYQFDYAILKLLELNQHTDTIIVEGIEDVDISTATEETAVQCKYYSKTAYNHSKIAKPIRLMLNHYKEVINGAKQKVNYKLYGYFESGQGKLTTPIDTTFLKENFLTYTQKGVQYHHHVELTLDDNDLNDFIALLVIDVLALEYQTQLTKIHTLLMQQFNCNSFEAEHFYYNNALKVIKDIAVKGNITDRKVSKSDFITKINFKRILFNEWFINYKGRNKLFEELRKQYFTSLNISPFERFFVIEVPSINYVRSELKEVLFAISDKWSKYSKRTTDPFCPYVYLHNIAPQELIELKGEFHLEGFRFIDGFDFHGASFSPASISEKINTTSPIKLKLLNELDHIDLTLTEINKTKEVYQFHVGTEFFINNSSNIKHIKIQVSQLTDIKKII